MVFKDLLTDSCIFHFISFETHKKKGQTLHVQEKVTPHSLGVMEHRHELGG